MQHAFVRDADDPKPILELLAEYKAEIVEEEITDLPDDGEVRHTLMSFIDVIFHTFHVK